MQTEQDRTETQKSLEERSWRHHQNCRLELVDASNQRSDWGCQFSGGAKLSFSSFQTSLATVSVPVPSTGQAGESKQELDCSA